MQRDAIDRLGLSALLLEPEMLEAVEPDVHLVGTLLSLNKAMPETSKETARAVVRKVVAELERRLASRTRSDAHRARWTARRRSAARGTGTSTGTAPSAPTSRTTCRSTGTVVPERLIGYGRAAQAVKKDVILCIDQSGSMAASVVYASVFGAVLASMRSLQHPARRLRHQRRRPDRRSRRPGRRPVRHAARRRHRHQPGAGLLPVADQPPRRDRRRAHQRPLRGRHTRRDAEAGRRDEGRRACSSSRCSPSPTRARRPTTASTRAALAALGAPAFACTPDHFPEVMAAAIEKRPLPVPEA